MRGGAGRRGRGEAGGEALGEAGEGGEVESRGRGSGREVTVGSSSEKETRAEHEL